MKVTLLFGKYLGDPTGASAVMRFLKEGKGLFQQNGIDIRFFTRDDIMPRKDENQKINSMSESKNFKNKVMAVLKKLADTNPFAALLHSYIRSARASKVLVKNYCKQDHDDDVVFLHEFDTCYEYLKSREKSVNTKKTKVVLMLHDNGITHQMMLIEYPSLKNNLYYKILKKKTDYVFSHIDRLGYVSESSMKTFIKNNPGFDQNKLFFNHNGIPEINVPVTKYERRNKINICCVGTVNERKGQRLLVEAMAMLDRDQRNRIHINIVGDGDIKDELERFCIESNISEFITFLGKRNDIVEILSVNDVFILPSKNEGLPIAILEAMRQGLPIVASNTGGIPEMIEDGVSGLLIEPNKEAIFNILQNIEKFDWKEMGIQSRKLFDKKFSLKSMVKKYSEVFQELKTK